LAVCVVKDFEPVPIVSDVVLVPALPGALTAAARCGGGGRRV
jgi:hypothetical protein